MGWTPRDEVLDDWVLMRDDGVTVDVAARRIGISLAALEKHLERALDRGDARGSRLPFGRMPPEPRYDLPIRSADFRWTYSPSWRREAACETCGAPELHYCVSRNGEKIKKGHAARRRAVRSLAVAA